VAKQLNDTWYDDVVSVLKNRGSLRSVLESLGVDVTGAKENASGIIIKCPFHNDKKPSFSISSDFLGHCFSCGAGVNLVGLVAQVQGKTSKESIELLSEITGVRRASNDKVLENLAVYDRLFDYIKKFSNDSKLKSLVSKVPVLASEAEEIADFLKDKTASFSYDGVPAEVKKEVYGHLQALYPGSDLSSFSAMKFYFPDKAGYGISFPNYGSDGKKIRGIVVMSNNSEGKIFFSNFSPYSLDRDVQTSFYNIENAFYGGELNGVRSAILLGSPLTTLFLQEIGLRYGIASYDHINEKHFSGLKRFNRLFLFEKDGFGNEINDYTAKYLLQSGVQPYIIKNFSEKEFCDKLFELYLLGGKDSVSEYTASLIEDKDRCAYVLDYFINKITELLPPLEDGKLSVPKENYNISQIIQQIDDFLGDFNDIYTRNSYHLYIGEKIKEHYCREYAEINQLGEVNPQVIYGHMMGIFCNSRNREKVEFALKYASRYIVDKERLLIPRYVSNRLAASRNGTIDNVSSLEQQRSYNDFLIGLYDVVCKEANALLLMTAHLSEDKLQQMIDEENKNRLVSGRNPTSIQHPWAFAMSIERDDGRKGYSYAEIVDRKLGCFPFRTESQEKFITKLCSMSIFGKTVTKDDLCEIGLLRKEVNNNYTFLYPDFFIEPFEKPYFKKQISYSERGVVGFRCIKMSSASRAEFTTYVIPVSLPESYTIKESDYILRDLTGKIIPIKWSRIAGSNEKGYEISFKGDDKRFCPNIARLNNGKTIDEVFLLDIKGYRAMGYTAEDLYKKDDQGKYLIKYNRPLNNITASEEYRMYKALWEQFFYENPSLLRSLYKEAKGCVLTDQYARVDHATEPIRVISEIINDKLLTDPQFFLPDVARVLKINKVFETVAADLLHSETGLDEVSYWKNYVKNKRKMPDQILKKYAIGVVPDLRTPEKYDEFLDKMSRIVVDGKRVSEEDLCMANIITGRTGSYFQLSGRLLFSIHDQYHNTIAFSGRKSENDLSSMGKYVNSVASPWFSKATVFYGEGINKESISKNKSVIIVEGYMDAIALDSTNTLAIMGTAAFSPERLNYLEKNGVQKILICQDEDQGGRKSKIQSFEFLMNTNMEVWVSRLNTKNSFDIIKDIDELRKKVEGENPTLSSSMVTKELITQLWETAVPGFEFYINEIARDVWLKKIDLGFEQPVVDRANYELDVEVDEKTQQIRTLLEFTGVNELGIQDQTLVFDYVRNKINSLSNPETKKIYTDALDYYVGARSLVEEHPEFSTLSSGCHNTIIDFSDKVDDIDL